MTLLRRARIGLGVAGVVIGVVGIARDDRRIVWVAIGCLLGSAVLRIADRQRRRGRREPQSG